MIAKKESRKILSGIEIQVPCSEFVRLFLAIEAKEFDRPLNTHINSILKQYLGGKIPSIKPTQYLAIFFETAFAKRDSQITIRLYNSVLSTLPGMASDEMRREIENAIGAYLGFILRDNSEKTAISKNVVKQVRKHIVEWELESKDASNGGGEKKHPPL